MVDIDSVLPSAWSEKSRFPSVSKIRSLGRLSRVPSVVRSQIVSNVFLLGSNNLISPRPLSQNQIFPLLSIAAPLGVPSTSKRSILFPFQRERLPPPISTNQRFPSKS